MSETSHLGGSLTDLLERLEVSLATDAEIEAWESDREHTLRLELLRSSGIADVLSTRAQRAIIGNEVHPTRSMHWVRTWLASSRPILGLFGAPDAGKTFAAAWALTQVPGRYFQSNELAIERKAHFGRPSAQYEAARGCGLLVIDELGAEDDAVGAAKAIEDLLNRRQKHARRTLILGNIDKATLSERYGERTLSRLVGVGRVFRVGAEGFRSRGEG